MDSWHDQILGHIKKQIEANPVESIRHRDIGVPDAEVRDVSRVKWRDITLSLPPYTILITKEGEE